MDVKASLRQPQKVYPPLFITKKQGNFLSFFFSSTLSPVWHLTLETSNVIMVMKMQGLKDAACSQPEDEVEESIGSQIAL